MIHLLAFGNNYRDTINELPDCELDAENVHALFEPFCASVQIALSATRAQMRDATAKFLKSLKSGDLGILFYSGHGTTDRVGGKKAEAIVCNDFQLIYDFELRADLNKRAKGVMLAMAADSCYSGGLSKATKHHGKPRVVPANVCIRHAARLPAKTPAKPNAIYEACSANETASSTGHGGAWTNAFIEALGKREEKTTLPALHSRIRKLLPSLDYPQHPQFVCDKSLTGRTLKSFLH
jgi:hypothetical protein